MQPGGPTDKMLLELEDRVAATASEVQEVESEVAPSPRAGGSPGGTVAGPEGRAAGRPPRVPERELGLLRESPVAPPRPSSHWPWRGAHRLVSPAGSGRRLSPKQAQDSRGAQGRL